jgi:hypothetical protein
LRRNYGRLFERPLLERGVPNPRHLSNGAYLDLATAAARRGAERNGVDGDRVAVRFPSAGFAATRVTVTVRENARVALAAASGRAPSRLTGEPPPS